MENNIYNVEQPGFKHIQFALWGTIGIMIFYQAALATILLSLPKSTSNNVNPWAISLSQIVFMFAPMILIARKSPLSLTDIFRLKPVKNNFLFLFSILGLISIQAFVAGYGVVQEAMVPKAFAGFYKTLQQAIESEYLKLLGGSSHLDFLRAIAVGAVVPAVCEESLFRGFFQRSLEQKLSPMKSALIVGISFGIVHFNPIDIIPLIIIGFYLGILAYVSGSIILPIIIHLLNNAIAVVVIYYIEPNKATFGSSDIPLNYAIILCLTGFLFTAWITYSIWNRRENSKN